MAFIKTKQIFTEDELDFLYSSGFSGQNDAFDFFAIQGDMRILPLMDKVVDEPTRLQSEKEHMLWTCQLMIDFYTKLGDEESVKIVQNKKEEIKIKLQSS
jgi:hypothetical protein